MQARSRLSSALQSLSINPSDRQHDAQHCVRVGCAQSGAPLNFTLGIYIAQFNRLIYVKANRYEK